MRYKAYSIYIYIDVQLNRYCIIKNIQYVIYGIYDHTHIYIYILPGLM